MRRAAFAVLAVGLLAATGAAGGPADKADKKEVDRILGTWSAVVGEKEGRQAPEAELKDFRVTFGAAGKLTASHDGKDLEWSYKLDATKKPRQIDVTIKEGGEGRLFKGIYALEKDTLKICLAHPSAERPTEFATREGVKTMLLVLKREEQ